MKISILRQTQEGNGVDLVDFSAVELRSTFAPNNDATLVNKAYVDSVASGMDTKESCRVATLVAGGNIDLATGTLLVIDGVQTVAGDRVLVKNQTDPTENGIYVAATGAWTRSEDQDGSPASEVSSGNFTFIEEGSQAATGWVLTGDGLITIGTDDLIWTQFSKASEYTAGDGIDIAANVISVDVTDLAGSGLEDDGANNLRIATSAAGSGLVGGGGAALSVKADTVGGANLAKAVNVSINGLAVKIDDTTIGENGSGQLTLKDNAVTPAKLDTVVEVSAGTDDYVLAWDQTAGKMNWVSAASLVTLPGSIAEELIYDTDLTEGTPYGLTDDVAANSDIICFQNGILMMQEEYTLNTSTPGSHTLTLNDTANNKFKTGDIISLYYMS
jgi:hypothetical protein